MEKSQHRLEAEGTDEHGRFLRETSEKVLKQKPWPQRVWRPGVRKALFRGGQEGRDALAARASGRHREAESEKGRVSFRKSRKKL